MIPDLILVETVRAPPLDWLQARRVEWIDAQGQLRMSYTYTFTPEGIWLPDWERALGRIYVPAHHVDAIRGLSGSWGWTWGRPSYVYWAFYERTR